MAKKPIDVYQSWLGIADPERPPNHYTLLKLKRFEDDVEKIRVNYRKLNAHVRKYAAGEYGPESQALLNEMAKAMLCLTDAQRKGEYDAVLGRPSKQEGRRRPLEQILLANKAITPEQLAKVRSFSEAVGLPLRDAILQQLRSVPADMVMQAYAESIGLPFLDLADVTVDESLLDKVPVPVVRQHLCLPVMIDGEVLLVASPNPLAPNVEDDLRLRYGMPARTVLCTPACINPLIARYYSPVAIQSRAPAGAKPAKARKAAAKGDEAEPLTREQKLKRALQFAWIGVMVCVILYVAYSALGLIFGY